MKKEMDQIEIWLDVSFLPKAYKVGDLFRSKNHLFFEYDAHWLKSEHRFSIDPNLQLFSGKQTQLDPYGIFTDSAPDRWGRVLMDRREVVDAKTEDRPIKNLYEWDYLLGVHDETRMGAIRLLKNSVFLDDDSHGVPPITSLAELQEISRLLENEDEESLPSLKRWLSVLIAPGSSLGGARPKANFLNVDGSLWIAKFPKNDDKEDIGLWEGITCELAKLSGIQVPDFSIQKINGHHHTFMTKRFDRNQNRREMFVSAMTMLNKKDGEQASYLEIAEFIQENAREGDLHAQMMHLWRRMVFNVMVSNRDDHLRNHGFIRDIKGWYLSPAYDMNPSRDKMHHAISLSYDSAEPSLENLFESIDFLRLSYQEAVSVVKDVHTSLSQWKAVAKTMGAKNNQIDLMSSAFSLASYTLNLPKNKKAKNVKPQ